MDLTGKYVPYMLGVPSVKALVLGTVRDQYVLRQEYDTQNERGEWIHVIKDYYRPIYLIEMYWLDSFRHPGQAYGRA
jgi:hypothetical protein